MKKRLRNIAYAWAVLFCFVAGQVTAFSHQHLADIKSHSHLTKQNNSGATVKEKCYVCDTMHHTNMAIFTDDGPLMQFVIIDTQYTRQHDYKGIALILSADRGPPVV